MPAYYPIGDLGWNVNSGLTRDYRINRFVTACDDTVPLPGGTPAVVATVIGHTAVEVEHRITGKTLIVGWKGTARPVAPAGKEWKTARLADNDTYRAAIKGIRQIETHREALDATFAAE